MAPLNLQVMVNANNTSERPAEADARRDPGEPLQGPDGHVHELDFRNVGPGSGEKLAAQLEADVKAGALGVGEIMKSFGLTIKKADGTRLKLDDPELDPVWEKAADLKIPVFIHVADPSEFFQPLDYKNERWLEQALYPDRRYQDRSRFPGLRRADGRARSPVREASPNDVDPGAPGVARRRTSGGLAGCSTGCRISTQRSARCCTTSAGSRARRTTSSSSTRIGSCSARTAISPTSIRTTGGCSKPTTNISTTTAITTRSGSCTGSGLPDDVLKKLYYQNAMRIVPGIPKTGVSRELTTHGLLSRYRRRGIHRLASRRTSSSRRGHRVRVLDSLITGKRRNLDHVPGVEFLEGDLADLVACRNAPCDGVEYVLHQAAIPSVPRSVKDPLTSNRANIDGSLNLLVAARDAGVRRLVYAGSSSAYGDTPTLPKREDMPTNPLSPYALQKLVAEQYCQMFTRAVRIRDRDDSLLQRVRTAAGSGIAVLRRHLALRDSASGGTPAADLRRRRADARLHLRQPTSSTACCGRARRRRRRGPGHQRRDRRTDFAERAAAHDESDRRRATSRQSTKTRAPATSGTRRRTSPRRRSSWDTCRSWGSKRD